MVLHRTSSFGSFFAPWALREGEESQETALRFQLYLYLFSLLASYEMKLEGEGNPLVLRSMKTSVSSWLPTLAVLFGHHVLSRASPYVLLLVLHLNLSP